MDLELVLSPYDIAYQNELPLGENHRLLGTFPWLQWCQEHAPRGARLFAYRHAESGRTMLCSWVFSPAEAQVPIAVEVEGFDGSPTSIWPKGLLPPEVMVLRLRPVEEQQERAARSRMAKASAAKAKKQRQIEEKAGAVEWMRTHGLQDQAKMVASGRIPWSGRETVGDEAFDAAFASIKRAAHGGKTTVPMGGGLLL